MTIFTALVLTAAVAAAPQQSRSGADFHWKGVIAAGKTLEIKGVNGNVTATAGSGREAEVVAVRRARRSDPESVEIKLLEHADGITICTVYPSRRQHDCEPGERGMNNDNNDTEVTFTVKVPAGVHFAGRTVNGSVEATGLGADVYGYTVNGNVSVSGRGLAEASTVNGDVLARMGRADWSGPMEFTTVNGDVTVELPGEPNVDVRARTTNGDIETEFPLVVQGRWGPRRLSGKLGNGGRTLALETVNGTIAIHKAR
jgi:hypothetical protein